jgi:hypothetical protein
MGLTTWPAIGTNGAAFTGFFISLNRTATGPSLIPTLLI